MLDLVLKSEDKQLCNTGAWMGSATVGSVFGVRCSVARLSNVSMACELDISADIYLYICILS